MNWQTKAPLFVLAAAFGIGVFLFKNMVPFSASLTLATVLLLAFVVPFWFLLNRMRLEAGAFVLFLLMGFLRFYAYSPPSCEFEGTRFEPYKNAAGLFSGYASKHAAMLPGNLRRLELTLYAKEEGGAERRGQCKVSVIERAPFTELKVGEAAKFELSLRVFEAPKNPGQKDYRYAHWIKGGALQGSLVRVHKESVNKPLPKPGFFDAFLLKIAKLRSEHISFIRDRFSPETASLLFAVLAGEQSEIPFDLRQEFQWAGLSHLFAISGLHIGLVIAGLFYIIRLLLIILIKGRQDDFAARAGAVVSLLFLGAYVFYVGASPAAVRAAIIYSVILLGFLLRKEAVTLNSLGVAALITLLLNPIHLFNASFQLSYAAFFGVLVTFKYIMPDIYVKYQGVATVKGVAGAIFRNILAVSLASLVISILTIPFNLYYFQSVSLAGVFTNLLAIPLLSYFVLPFLIGGALFLTVNSVLVAEWLFNAGAFYLSLLKEVAFLGSMLPLSVYYPPFLSRALIYIFFFYLLLKLTRDYLVYFRAKRLLFAALPMALAAAGGDLSDLLPKEELKVTFLAVGQGDSAAVELPDRKVMVIDAPGGRLSYNTGAGRNIVAPFLSEKGYDKIDYLVMSHPHMDHFGGMQYLAEAFQIGEFWHSGDKPDDSRRYEDMIEALKKRGAIPYVISEETPERTLAEGVKIRIFNPTEKRRAGGASETYINNNSLTFSLCYFENCLLFTGDIQRQAERRITAKGHNISAKVLKVPHHGSKTSSTPEFLRAVDPMEGIFTTRSLQHRHFPNPAVLERYKDMGIKVLCPEVEGAITYTLDKRGGFKRKGFLQM